MLVKRGDNSFSRWWWSIDNVFLLLTASLIVVGLVLTTTASPPVAERLNISSFYFAHRQFFFLAIAAYIIFILSILDEKKLRQLVLVGFVGCVFLMIVVLFVGEEVKGAKRWLSILGISLQPSELIKPFYITITGLLLSEKFNRRNFPGFSLSIALHILMVTLLILQPDFGMVITFSAVLAGQFFLAGLPLWWIIVAAVIAVVGGIGAYTFLPHVTKRVDSFLNPEASENYQVEKSLEAYVNGGLLGKGPGEGTVKSVLPDSHTDFIFAVAGEEFGAIVASMIILLFALIVFRGVVILSRESSLFKIYSGAGIIMLFALQTVFNVGVTLHLFPTKGMTLPFISYGGSSILCFSIAFGIFLNLTKREYGISVIKDRKPSSILYRNASSNTQNNISTEQV